MKTKCVKTMAVLLSGAMLLQLTALPHISAAAKPKLKTKKLSIKVSEKKKIKVKNAKKAKLVFKSKKPAIAKVSKKGVVTARKAGKTTITVKMKKGKRMISLGKVSVTVKKASAKKPKQPTEPTFLPPEMVSPSPSPASGTTVPATQPAATQPAATQPAATQTPATTPTPSPTPVPTPLPEWAKDDPAASSVKSFVDENYEVDEDYEEALDGVKYSEAQKFTYYSQIAQKERPANIILPANYDENKEYNVLYLLHGVGGWEGEWLQGNPEYIVGNLVALGKTKEMIIVIPNQIVQVPGEKMPSNYLDPGRFVMFNRFLQEMETSLVPYIEDHYNIKPGRDNHAIAGLSMGGRNSLYVGINMLYYFGYIGAFEPAPGVLPYSAEDGLFTKESFTIPEEYRTKTLLMIQQGDADKVVYDNPTQYHNALVENGVDHIFYNVPYAHDWKAWKDGLYNFTRRIFQDN